MNDSPKDDVQSAPESGEPTKSGEQLDEPKNGIPNIQINIPPNEKENPSLANTILKVAIIPILAAAAVAVVDNFFDKEETIPPQKKSKDSPIELETDDMNATGKDQQPPETPKPVKDADSSTSVDETETKKEDTAQKVEKPSTDGRQTRRGNMRKPPPPDTDKESDSDKTCKTTEASVKGVLGTPPSVCDIGAPKTKLKVSINREGEIEQIETEGNDCVDVALKREARKRLGNHKFDKEKCQIDFPWRF